MKVSSQRKQLSTAPGTRNAHACWNYTLDFYCNLSRYCCLVDTSLHSPSSARQGGWARRSTSVDQDQDSYSLRSVVLLKKGGPPKMLLQGRQVL